MVNFPACLGSTESSTIYETILPMNNMKAKPNACLTEEMFVLNPKDSLLLREVDPERFHHRTAFNFTIVKQCVPTNRQTQMQTQRDRHRHRQTYIDTDTYKQTYTHMQTQTDRHT